MTNRIEWTSGPYSSADGRVGVFPLFHIGYVGGDKAYALSTNLPVKMKEARFETEGEAQAYAERVLRSFVKKIGAGFLKEES